MKIVMINYEDTSVEILDVQDSMVKEDVDEFLCEHEYDLDNICWMVAQDDKITVRGHEYRMGKRSTPHTSCTWRVWTRGRWSVPSRAWSCAN